MQQPRCAETMYNLLKTSSGYDNLVWRITIGYVNNLPAQKEEAQENAWFSHSDAEIRRQKSHSRSAQKSADALGSVTRRHKTLGGMRTGRFRGRSGLGLVLARGMRYDHPEVGLRCLPGARAEHRVAVLCPKRVVPQAVGRNRIRRVFFEASGLVLRDIAEPIDCAILVRGRIDSRHFGLRDADKLVAEALRKMAASQLKSKFKNQSRCRRIGTPTEASEKSK